jgi:hypothetical protein
MENYQEIQKFRQWWLWAIIVLFPIFVTIAKCIEVKAFVIETMIVVLFFVPFILFFYVLSLKTSIDQQGITLTFKPFLLNHKMIAFGDIVELKMVTYKPLIDCGGWGLRWYKCGTAYTVSGNQGIEILLKNNDLLLIGTQKPEAFIAAIQTFNVVK